MDAADFDLHVSLPADPRFGEAMRDLAVHAARYAGCAETDAARYGAVVEAVVVACLERSTAGSDVPVVLRRGHGPVEFLIGCERGVDSPASDDRITIRWTNERGTSMCSIALNL